MNQADFPVVVDSEGTEVPWVGLNLVTGLANSTEQIDSNIERTLASVYEPFNPLIAAKTGAVAIVGSGPSLKGNWQDLKKFKGDIIACNASCQFLSEKGIDPTYCMIFDADVLADAFVQECNPNTTYLLASRCHPVVFEKVEAAGCKYIVWHAKGDLNLERLLPKYRKMEPMVGGGSASVTRAMFLAQAIGYKVMHLWGADSSYVRGETDTHIGKSTTEERYMQIGCAGRIFDTTAWMASQAEDFKVLVPSLQRIGIKVVVHGDGLIPHIAKQMQLDVDGEPRFRQFVREAKLKARILWQSI